MSSHYPYPQTEHKARLLLGDPVAQAWEWITQYAASLSATPHPEMTQDEIEYQYGGNPTITADDLIDIAMNVLYDSGPWDKQSLNRGGLLEGEMTDPLFWDKLAVLKGIVIPLDKSTNFFACSC